MKRNQWTISIQYYRGVGFGFYWDKRTLGIAIPFMQIEISR